MNFVQVLAKVFANVVSYLGSAIDLTSQANSYIFYSLLSQVAFISTQQNIALSNNLSVFSATGIAQNGLGYAFGYKVRPYYPIILNCTITGENGTEINPGLEVTYTDTNGNIYYFVCYDAVEIIVGTTAEAVFYYVDQPSYLLEEILAGELDFIPDSTNIPTGSISSVSNNASVTPVQYSDLDYRDILENIYQQSAIGLDGAIQLAVLSLSFITSCRVYFGTNPSVPTVISGSLGNYLLDYGIILIIVNPVYVSSPALGYLTYIQNLIANTIYNRWNFDNKTYNNSNAFGNQISVPVTSVAGNNSIIDFYNADIREVSLNITMSPGSQKLTETQLIEISKQLEIYVNNIPISGNMLFSEISAIFTSLGFSISSVNIGGSPGTIFSLAADQVYFYTGLSVSY
jgi:hypothetical protein